MTGSWDLETVCVLWAAYECCPDWGGAGGCLRGGGGGWISRHKLPLSAWAIMALHCPAASLQYGYDLSLSLTPSPGPLQSPPIAGFSTRQSGQISALCLSALIDWMSLLPVECARSSAVSQRRGCQARAWLEPSGLEGSYHSCQITDSLTPPSPNFLLLFLCFPQTSCRWKNYEPRKRDRGVRCWERKRERERRGEEDTKAKAGFKSSMAR